ncbi:MAG TPA: transferrin receptor-like dimerization domain-containing protein [Thermoanaerobaculia bacterium]|nr:transferrin receptor-like dimerization domain-containing protein [Thermoanaerobaculia bacterium]
MRRLFLLLVTTAALSAVAARPSEPVAPAGTAIKGFSSGSAEKQRALEGQFDRQVQPANLRSWMERLAARPHHLGSARGKENAEFIASMFRSWGFETKIETYRVLFPTPRVRILEMTAPTPFTLRLSEPPLPEDRTSNQTAEQLPLYNAYSADGDVSGELVYVNYGVPRDYEELAKHGVDVRGKIVIARYGGSWRGIKPKVAAEKGAIGCIIYSDPRDDGYYQGDVYPAGAYRNEHGGQRGSVADMPVYSGDPLTPGVAATENARRLERSAATTITRIPVMPISYGDALPLLRALGGPVAPPDWRGALPITYHLGPGPTRVRLKLEFNWDLVPAYNVVATLRGTDRADQWIIRGNHHDAWVNGADDPISGLVAMMEEARGISELRKTGWKPRRTIIYCAWDGEEQGLLGSTEWVEDHLDDLQRHGAVYINSDSNGRGFLSAGGSHGLERFVTEAARDVPDPQRGVSVLERLNARRVVLATSEEERKAARDRLLIKLDALGSGSDFTPFLQFAGVAVLNVSYGGEDGGGSYHSVYDSFDHYIRFGDTKFEYGIAQAKTAGRMVLRLAGGDTLPFEFARLAETVSGYVSELVKLADETRARVEEKNRQLRERTMEIAADPTKSFVPPPPDPPVPHLEFAPLLNAAAELIESAKAFDRAASAVSSDPELDRVMMRVERTLTSAEGLPGRPWYRHYIYAPGRYTGYGVKTLPAVREAIELQRWDEANREIVVTAKVIRACASELNRAASRFRTKESASATRRRSRPPAEAKNSYLPGT